MTAAEGTRYHQTSAYRSPWSLRRKVGIVLWDLCWVCFCRWTPKPLNPWRLFWLRVFGCRLSGLPFVHQSAIIHMPWNLTLHDRACLGEGATAYALGAIEIGARATVAQQAYLCTGTHDFADPALALVTAPITVAEDAFIGARAFLLPGVAVGAGAVIGAAAVVTKDMPAWTICAGHPCRPGRPRVVSPTAGGLVQERTEAGR